VVERGHLVAGFGRIAWIEAAELHFGGDASALAIAEPEIVGHMNRDHAEAIELYARHLLGRQARGWQMTGIDPEGLDLRCGGEIARLDFAAPVLSPAAARRTLVDLAQKAAEAGG
jgi:putative heme iron utilization protein